MRDLRKFRVLPIAVCLVLGTVFIASFATAQEESDEALKKKYAPIIGEYTFDLVDLGGEVTLLKYYVRDGELWADSGDGRPAVMKPVEGEVFTFTAEDPFEGVFRIKFDKDEQGEYTICQVANEAQGMAITGKKIK